MTTCMCRCRCPNAAQGPFACPDCKAGRHQEALFEEPPAPKARIYTTGYTGQKPQYLRRLAELLHARVLDIRYSPNSRVQQWRRPALEKLLGVRYWHVVELGNMNYKGGDVKIFDLVRGLEIMDAQLTTSSLNSTGCAFEAVILMCGCKKYDECHRADVATALIDQGREVIEIEDWPGYVAELEAQ